MPFDAMVQRSANCVEKLTERAHGYLTQKERAERDARLDTLAARLKRDDDWRTEESLRRLRALYELFEREPADGHSAVTIREKVERLFHAAVEQLERSIELWEKARRLPAGTQRPIVAKRKEAINEVVLTVNHLTKTVEQYHAFQADESNDNELSKLRAELDATIEVARRADDRIGEIRDTTPLYDESEFE